MKRAIERLRTELEDVRAAKKSLENHLTHVHADLQDLTSREEDLRLTLHIMEKHQETTEVPEKKLVFHDPFFVDPRPKPENVVLDAKDLPPHVTHESGKPL